jgi:serine protease Do
VLVGVSWEGYVLHPDATGAAVWSDPVSVMTGCTGWFAAEDGHIVTAGHCVDPAAVTDATRIRASFKSGTVSSSQVSPDGVAGTEVNAELSYGMSGGPTINDRGEVLGVNSFITLGDARNFNFITDATALRTYLERLDVELAPTPSPSATAPGDTVAAPRTTEEGGFFEAVPVWAYAAAGVGLVLFVGLTTMALRRRPARVPALAPAAASAAQAGSLVGEHCAHEGNSFGASFCQNCGRPIAQPVG